MSITIQSNPTYSNLFFFFFFQTSLFNQAWYGFQPSSQNGKSPSYQFHLSAGYKPLPPTPPPGHLSPTRTVVPHPYKIGMKRHPRIAAPRFKKAPTSPEKCQSDATWKRRTRNTEKNSSALILGASIHPSRSVGGLLFGNAIFHGRANVREGFCR